MSPFKCCCFLYSVSILTLKFLSVTMLDITRRQDKYPHFCSPKAGTPIVKYLVVIELRKKSCLRLGVVAYLPKATSVGPERFRDFACLWSFPVSHSLSAFAADNLCFSGPGVTSNLECAIFASWVRKAELI